MPLINEKDMQPYNSDFFRKEEDLVLTSARQVVPLLMRLLNPTRVIDVGCGRGTWLSVFAEHGVSESVGIDGAYIDPATLKIPPERFRTFDLTQPLRLNETFDLVLSLEVAEHLPPETGGQFVESLTMLGPAVLFSAAIPFQGGVNHVNEQWPSYWTTLFLGRGYVMIDCIRQRIWENEQVADYYAQNMLLFCRHDFLETHPALRAEQAQGLDGLSIVHPRRFVDQAKAMRRLYAAAADLRLIIPPGTRFILADEEEIRGVVAVGYDALPFLECDGQYWGKPLDAQTAIAELERMRRDGARFIAFAWPAIWWLEHYVEFHRYLSERYPCVLRNERFIIFDLS